MVTWTGALGVVILTLMEGTGDNMTVVYSIGATRGRYYASFLWKVDPDTPVGQYVLRLEDVTDQIAYSPQFTIEPFGWTSGTTSG
jgi:hypothetical protein